MGIRTPPSDRPTPVDPWGGAPEPAEAELQAAADSAWAVELGLIDDLDAGFAHDLSDGPGTESARTDAPNDAVSLAALLLDRLDDRARERHRATAAEYGLIHRVLAEAVADPEPWVGPDPTLDGIWHDPRGRTAAAVRRDRLDMAERAAVAEIAVRLRVAEQTVRSRAAHAETLRERCPRLWAAFAEGDVSERHAVEAAQLAASLPDDADSWEAFNTGVLDRALRLPPARFCVSARALRERVHAESIEIRHRRARHDRGVWMTAELDGMATLTALLPADRATEAMTRVDRLARHLSTAPDEERTLTQLRADAFADLLTAPAPTPDNAASAAAPMGASPATTTATSGPSVAPSPGVIVTIPALTLLGADTTPATLDGFGPIDLDTARRLAGEATSWIRLLTHPVTGAPLALDRTAYRVPAALRRWLGVTSPTCVFPGCGRPARECDLDHLRAWSEGGPTDDENLEPECRHHHRIRHETRWSPARDPDTGELMWTSPLGTRIDADPPPF